MTTEKALGISMPWLRQAEKSSGRTSLALKLWASGIHETRILACPVKNPELVSE